LYLRGVTWKLLADRKYKEFSKPVDPEEVCYVLLKFKGVWIRKRYLPL